MSSFGKWSLQGVPKNGWTCIGFEDLDKPAPNVKCAKARTSGMFTINSLMIFLTSGRVGPK
ncbi:hypothetical protein PhaeoP83_04272 (plasmid) [Phaeobacter inhibens]|uniref:Uncharacterized protein n=1 Tax=Phaeobacter inhibens TaxID=221822 RepID=A0ABM6RLD7_9RHOB|nr:hypothetical protein PhaeoP83_04272 [Phaeobacter inhibens]AUQ97095.1 hypothetical protein PhaeoP66_04369 [Phaeobacter inhibens]AUR22295.1 hypothetical protein PhaeoP80_04272 [Phaeobacter inhibens]